MRALSQARFDSMVAYCRMPLATYYMRELAWFEEGSEKVLGALIVDTDGEYHGHVLARDLNEKFRSIGMTRFHDSAEQALIELHKMMNTKLKNLEQERDQGDETGGPVDFFQAKVEQSKLSRGFTILADDPGFAPARAIVSEMMRWHEDVDGNFIEQFQTTGFDARIWELYLFAAMTESNLGLTRPDPAPDFLCAGIGLGEFAMEATTINPTKDKTGKPVQPPRPSTDDELTEYVQHYLPAKYAGPLTAKLKKEYWTKAACKDKPLVFAIQDFHDSMSMTRSKPGLGIYLYGYVHDVLGEPTKIEEHVWGTKRIKSGFFSLPGADNVSAVIFNASGTLSKFNRVGVSTGFGDGNVVLVRRGDEYNVEPGATRSRVYQDIVTEGYHETWVEGLEVFHNPTAKHPLHPDFLPGAVHNYLLADGNVRSDSPTAAWAPLNSVTSVIAFPTKTS